MKFNYKKICFCFILVFVFLSFNVFPVFAYLKATTDPESYGKGLSWDECSEEQKKTRRDEMLVVFSEEFARTIIDALGISVDPVKGIDSTWNNIFGTFEGMKLVQDGDMSALEYLNSRCGIDVDDYIKGEDFDPDNIDLTGLEITIPPDILNAFQDCINKINNGSDKIRLYTRTPYTRVDWSPKEGDNNIYSGAMPEVSSRYLNAMLKEHLFVWIDSVGGDPAHSLRCCWLEGNLNEYCFYAGGIYNDRYGDLCNVYVKRADGQPVTYHYQYFAYPSMNDISYHSSLVNDYPIGTVTAESYQTICCGVGQVHNTIDYGCELFALKHARGGYRGIITTSGMFTIFNDLGAALSASILGGSIPEIIQPSYKNTYHNESYKYTVGDKSYNTYNYDYIVNEIGDPTGMSDQEIQNKIDEIMKTLQTSIETGNKIDEEGFNNFNAISSDNNELLNRILVELREIKHAIEDIEIDTGGGFLNTLSNLATGIASIVELLKDIFVDGVKDVGTDIVDIGEDIAGDVSISGLLVAANAKLDGILAELGFLVNHAIAEDAAELIGDSIDTGNSIGNEITKKFPFCIPWDISLIIDCLASPPATPVFELPLSIPSYGIDETITVDLSDFQLLSDVARWFFDVLFGLAITKLTMKILEIDLVHD